MTDTPKKLKAAVILDNNKIKKWQTDAIQGCADVMDITLVLNCQNTQIKRSYAKHFLYYVINATCLKSPITLSSDYKNDGEVETIDFSSINNKGWQSFPDDLIKLINEKKLDLIIKFGMNLLVIPDNLETRYGIISYHHGDPTKYRGRPAGFYETLKLENRVGMIVQRLSNKLDGGDIYAKAFSKIWHHSYKKTAANFYRNSVPVLRKAVLNAQNGIVEANSAEGFNYRLPSNLQSLSFFYALGIRKIQRLIYGAFYEKKWNIVVCHDERRSPLRVVSNKLRTQGMVIPKIDDKYVFYADPFFSADGSKIYAEALDSKTGLGEIVTLDASTGLLKKLLLKGNHFSYPQALLFENTEYLLPEIASFSAPCFLKLNGDNPPEYQPILGLESSRLVDATYFEHNGAHYIFACYSASSMDNLQLFVSTNRQGPYSPHPMSPIVIDPTCARMAGAIVNTDGKLFRLGQNNSYSYGDKVWLCQITQLSPESYAETPVSEIAFEDNVNGPHTINFHQHSFVADFYKSQFSLLAGYRRLGFYLKKKLKV